MVEIYNEGKNIVELHKDRPIGILDLHYIGYYKVNYQRLIAMAQERFDLFHYCKKIPSDKKAEQYNRMSGSQKGGKMNCPRRERTDPYLWLAPDDPCRFQTDQ